MSDKPSEKVLIVGHDWVRLSHNIITPQGEHLVLSWYQKVGAERAVQMVQIESIPKDPTHG